jgi:hypothetical protein
MTYKGIFRIKHIAKYKGDHTKIIYRSLWERQVFRWCDENPNVVSWGSEEIVIPYVCKTDGKVHRYFVDLFIKFSNGKEYLIEIKPKKQTQPPKPVSRKTPKYVAEVMGYAKNISKWQAAEAYCKDKGLTFEVWTEETIKGLGIKLLT